MESKINLSGGTYMRTIGSFFESYGLDLKITCSNLKGDTSNNDFGNHRLSEVSDKSGGKMNVYATMTVNAFVGEFEKQFGNKCRLTLINGNEILGDWTIKDAKKNAINKENAELVKSGYAAMANMFQKALDAQKKEEREKQRQDSLLFDQYFALKKEVQKPYADSWRKKSFPKTPEDWLKEYQWLKAEIMKDEPYDYRLGDFLKNHHFNFSKNHDYLYNHVGVGNGTREVYFNRINQLEDYAVARRAYRNSRLIFPHIVGFKLNEYKKQRKKTIKKIAFFSLVLIAIVSLSFIIYNNYGTDIKHFFDANEFIEKASIYVQKGEELVNCHKDTLINN